MAWWGMVFRVALESIATFGQTFVFAWRSVGNRSAGSIGLTPGKKMTMQEAYKILGLQNPATPRQIQERYRVLSEANNQEGSLYLRHKVEIAKNLLLPKRK